MKHVEASPYSTVDVVLFALVIVVTVAAGGFQGWLQALAPEAPGGSGLALPRGKGPILDFLHMMTLTCSVPFVLGSGLLSN